MADDPKPSSKTQVKLLENGAVRIRLWNDAGFHFQGILPRAQAQSLHVLLGNAIAAWTPEVGDEMRRARIAKLERKMMKSCLHDEEYYNG